MTPNDLDVGSIVIGKNHPEWGFGVIRQRDEDAFGDLRFQVQFDHENQHRPCVAEDLDVCPSPEELFQTGDLGQADAFKRKLLAGIVLGENTRTGAFIRSALQPLPHQVHFLDRVLSGQRLGHLAADDVGLGKTIEAGLLISHYNRDSHPKKILILCPAGLALQWQDEMLDHFNLRFSVAKRDFNPRTNAGWDNRSLVIGSIDTLKGEKYFKILQEAGPFDLVIVDEAHRLSARREFLSGDLRTTEAYRFVKKLMEERVIVFSNADDGTPRSPKMLFLSATPHQGDNFRFALLLGLIRPDLFPGTDPEIESNLTPENLFECITKTPKSRAIDWDGKTIFKGHTSLTRLAGRTEAENEVAGLLSLYIRRSMDHRHGGGQGLALVVELVMHTFHKLAASSWAALREAMQTRLKAIRGETAKAKVGSDEEDEESVENALKEQSFYPEEEADIASIIEAIDALRSDSKTDLFAETLWSIDDEEPRAKVLIFTQYYATQNKLVYLLQRMFPGSKCALINGSMGVEERQKARRNFEEGARFLVSTEAGGEGINLQKKCHVMINFDLPWNPMRLQQRIGRLDRYGQEKHVQVYNLAVSGSWDDRITIRIMERLSAIQDTLGPIASNLEDYREMILGEVGEGLDPRKAFSKDSEGKEKLSDEEIDRRLREAAEAVRRATQMGFEKTAFQGLDTVPRPVLGSEDFKNAFEMALQHHGISLHNARSSDKQWLKDVFQFEPPDAFKESRLRASKKRYVVFDKERYAQVRGSVLAMARGQEIRPELAGFGDAFTDWLFESAFWAKNGETAFSAVASIPGATGSGWLKVASLRWRGNLRSLRAPDGIMVIWIGDDGEIFEVPFNDLAANIKNIQDASLSLAGGEFPMDEGKSLVQARLAELVGPGKQARALAGWSWSAIARITPAADTSGD